MNLQKEYNVKLSEGGELKVRISANLDSTGVEPEKVLPEYALCSRNFYLDFGRELTEQSRQ